MTNFIAYKFILFISTTFLLCGCGMSNKMVNFEYDDSKSYVINVLGKPDGKKLDGEYEPIRYTNKRISTWSNDKADYNFVFKNGKLVEFGTSNVRSNKLGHIIPYNPYR